MSPVVPIHATYDYRLVALSVIIAIFASYAALELAGRVTAARNSARVAWLLGGASAMGTGIWSMHYTGMLAYRLPIPVYYHVPTVALSLLAAIFASFIALFVVSRQQLTTFRVVIGSLLMGAGIATMHYTGMAAVSFSPMAEAPDLTNALDISAIGNAAIVVVTFVIMGSVFLLQRWFAPQNTVQSEA